MSYLLPSSGLEIISAMSELFRRLVALVALEAEEEGEQSTLSHLQAALHKCEKGKMAGY